MRGLTWQDVVDNLVMVAGFAIFLAFVVNEFSGDEARNLVFLLVWTLCNRYRENRRNSNSGGRSKS